MAFRHTGVRSTVILGIVSLLAAGLAAAESASARTKTNYYSASTDVSTVRYATTAANATTVTFTITNCGAAFAPPVSCANAKGTSIDSVTIALPSGWSSPSALTATGLKLAPGASVTMPVKVLPTTTGAGTALPVTLTVLDSNGGAIQPTNAGLTLEVPLQFTFTQSPSTGTPATSLCNTAVQLTDGFTPADNVPLAVSVTLDHATGSLDPSLSFNSTTTRTTSAVTGAATFGCDPQPAVGGPYQVVVVGSNAGASIPSDSSSSFVVYKTLKDCNGNCNATELGGGGTQLDATSNASGVLGTSVFDVADPHYPTFDCAGVKKLVGRPDVLQASSDGDKTVVITWSKAVTLKFTDNGTPHWQVCMEAPAPFYNDAGVLINTPNAAGFYVGTVPLCGAAGIPAGFPCMAVSRNAAQEIATITLPGTWAGDPLFH